MVHFQCQQLCYRGFGAQLGCCLQVVFGRNQSNLHIDRHWLIYLCKDYPAHPNKIATSQSLKKAFEKEKMSRQSLGSRCCLLSRVCAIILGKRCARLT